MNTRRTILGFGLTLPLLPSVAQARIEDIYKGRIIITKDRLPMRFSSESAFIAAVKRQQTDRVWPKEEKGNDHAVWVVEYIAFFAKPLNDNELSLKFWEISGGSQRYVAGDEQYTREKNSRIFAANITVAKPEFEENKRYYMTLQSRGRIIATTTFWLRGKGANYSGKVEFSDDEAKQR